MINKRTIVLFCILFIGLILRLYGNNWDQGWHLHPDERFLTMVGIDVKIPTTISSYLDQYTSSFNPVNKGHAFYVYGTFPLLINKAVAQFLYNDTYDLFNLQGRALSGVADFLILLIIFKIVELVEKKIKLHRSVKYTAIFLYSFSVLPIQLSHFFAADTFMNLFCWMSLYYAIKGTLYKDSLELVPRSTFTGVSYLCLSGIFFGLALACKISALYFAPLVGIVILITIVSREQRSLFPTQSWIFFGLLLFTISTYLALRFGSPYYFQTNNIFNPQLSVVFINNIKTLQSFEDPTALFPPANQWIHASPFLSITNVIFFGVGPIYFIFSVIGFIYLWSKQKWGIVRLMLIWVIGFTVYQSVQFAKTMRYLLFIYPFLAIFAAVGIQQIVLRIRSLAFSIRLFIYFLICISILYWPLAFISIYMQDHSRVAASKWMFQEIPKNSIILTEYWDDPLPLMVQDPRTKNFIGNEVHIFDPDTKEKWVQINSQLQKGDYYSMSSNRGWGSIPKTPERYPAASLFYKKMFEGTAGYRIVKQFSSYPSLRYLGIPVDFPDQWSEEAFTVYDHPLVTIFKKV